ncbi:MAG: thioesterase family protein [Aestuariivirga sp.]|nr:thioesterase family protein [Aestuariivirga sp.]
MTKLTRILSGTVKEDWVDYNGHMADYAFAIVFSDTLTAFMDIIGIDERYRKETANTIYTIDIRITYLRECHKEQKFHVLQQMLDVDAKRFHTCLRMVDDLSGEDLARSEQLLMHVHRDAAGVPRSLPFSPSVSAILVSYKNSHRDLGVPAWVGSRIGIRRK